MLPGFCFPVTSAEIKFLLWTVVFLPTRPLLTGPSVGTGSTSSFLSVACLSLCPRENSLLEYHPCTPQALLSHPGTRQLFATYLFRCNLRTHFSWSLLLFPLRLPSSPGEHRPSGASVLTVGHRGVWERDFGRQMPRVGCSGLCPVYIPVVLEGDRPVWESVSGIFTRGCWETPMTS